MVVAGQNDEWAAELMATCVDVLRAINLGAKRKFPKAEPQRVLEETRAAYWPMSLVRRCDDTVDGVAPRTG